MFLLFQKCYIPHQFIFLGEKKQYFLQFTPKNILLRNMVWSTIGLFFSIKVRDEFPLLLACIS
jgi:hypothetical protein